MKARPLLAAAGATLRPDPRAGPSAAAPRPAPVRRPRPDPAAGVFETVLAVDGRAVALDAHARRLESSALRLYGVRLRGVREALAAAAAQVPAGLLRLRLACTPDGRVSVASRRVPDEALLPTASAVLEPLTVPGGIGEHKWLDRGLLDGEDAEPLVVDLDGGVLESGYGNVFVVEGDALVTPPADGRILPGVTRAALLEVAPHAGLTAREEPIALDRLRAADAVFVTSSIRLLQPVAGTPAAAVAPLAAALCRHWDLPVAAPC